MPLNHVIKLQAWWWIQALIDHSLYDPVPSQKPLSLQQLAPMSSCEHTSYANWIFSCEHWSGTSLCFYLHLLNELLSIFPCASWARWPFVLLLWKCSWRSLPVLCLLLRWTLCCWVLKALYTFGYSNLLFRTGDWTYDFIHTCCTMLCHWAILWIMNL